MRTFQVISRSMVFCFVFAIPPASADLPAMRLWLVDGSRLDGQLESEADQQPVVWNSPVFLRPLTFTKESIARIAIKGEPDFEIAPPLDPKNSPIATPPVGQLRTPQAEAFGRIVSVAKQDDAPLLQFQIELAENSSELAPSASGSIFYRDPEPNVDLATNQSRLCMTLRSGDVIEGEVVSIKNDRLSFQSPRCENKTFDSSEVHSVTIGRMTRPLRFTSTEIDRLLTVPRKKKDTPPTHLLFSVSCDLLATRLIELDKSFASIELRSEKQRIARRQIAKIVWLHEKLSDEQFRKMLATNHRLRVNYAEDQRIMLRPTTLLDETLYGHSDLLGIVNIPVDQLTSIWFGQDAGIEPPPTWTLRPSKLPRSELEGK